MCWPPFSTISGTTRTPEFGRLRLPRYALANLAMARSSCRTRPGPPERRPPRQDLLAGRLTKLPQATRVAAAGDVCHRGGETPFKRCHRSCHTRVARFGVVAPEVGVVLLVGPRLARDVAVVRDSSDQAPSTSHLSHDVKAPAVVRHSGKQIGEPGSEGLKGCPEATSCDNSPRKRIRPTGTGRRVSLASDHTEAFPCGVADAIDVPRVTRRCWTCWISGRESLFRTHHRESQGSPPQIPRMIVVLGMQERADATPNSVIERGKIEETDSSRRSLERSGTSSNESRLRRA